jgi:hypothetical protein
MPRWLVLPEHHPKSAIGSSQWKAADHPSVRKMDAYAKQHFRGGMARSATKPGLPRQSLT